MFIFCWNLLSYDLTAPCVCPPSPFCPPPHLFNIMFTHFFVNIFILFFIFYLLHSPTPSPSTPPIPPPLQLWNLSGPLGYPFSQFLPWESLAWYSLYLCPSIMLPPPPPAHFVYFYLPTPLLHLSFHFISTLLWFLLLSYDINLLILLTVHILLTPCPSLLLCSPPFTLYPYRHIFLFFILVPSIITFPFIPCSLPNSNLYNWSTKFIYRYSAHFF